METDNNNLSHLKKNLNISSIVFYAFLLFGYLFYTFFGILIIANNDNRLACTNMWIYTLVSILIPFAVFLIQLCAFPFLFTDIKNLSYFSCIMVIFGGLTIFSCNDINNLWVFSIITFIIQIFIALFPIIMKIYLFFYGLKTPCCCCDDSTVEENNNLKFDSSI
jgi:hypothetical protein